MYYKYVIGLKIVTHLIILPIHNEMPIGSCYLIHFVVIDIDPSAKTQKWSR